MNDSAVSIDPVKLDKLAEVAIKIGLQLQEGQDLVITAPLASVPLVRLITKHAYMAGGGLVTAFYSDEDTTLFRFRHAHDSNFDKAAGWLYEGMAKAYGQGAARLAISGDNPMMLSAEDPAKVSRANKANSMAHKPAMEKIVNFDINWNIVSYPNLSWARQIFPDLSEEAAVKKLADAIFAASRVDVADPVSAWKAHKASLAKNGVTCNPNIPTEEVFTTPHALRVSGHASSTKPLSYQGSLIDNIRVRFEEGRIVEASASKGQDALLKVLDSDEGARRIGEVALVPHSSPISASGLLFYNTLFDENAASHIALGQCYSKCFVDGGKLTPDEIKSRGGNASMIHIDWMIGSGEIDVDGIHKDGSRLAVMRKGEWA
ncbi:MAG: aminopeptidase [Pseudomonadota bacterium]